jgi:ABC-2 type transport system ATP-binding protein
MGLRRHPRRRVLAVLVAVIAVLAAGGVTILLTHQPAHVTSQALRIAVADGPGNRQHVQLDATFFTPPGSGRVPAILLAHGFGETKDAVRPEAERLARAGFAVLTWSARGFGASTGRSALDSPDYEVKDVQQLVSWLARQPRVLLDGPGNPRVGITGASYGGGIALLAAAYDHRIDAIVPQSTWYNLATALFPNAVGGGPEDGVFKREWAGLLFTQGSIGFGAAGGASAGGAGQPAGDGGAAGTGQGTGTSQRAAPARAPGSPQAVRAALCGRLVPQVCAVYQQVATLGRATPQAVSLLLRSSPASVAHRITVPTLLIQGETDSLFGLDQADGNYQAIRHSGAPVDMVWIDGGHDGGNQQASRVDQLTVDWFGRWLKHEKTTGPPAFAVTRNLGPDPSSGQDVLGVATAASYPGLAGTRRTMVRLTGPAQTVLNPPGGSPPAMSVFPGLAGPGGPGGSGGSGGGAAAAGAGGLSFDMPGQSAAFTSASLAAPLQVTGSPTVRVRVSGPPDVTLFAKVYDIDQAGNQTLPFQLAAPLRVTGAGTRGGVVTVTLPAIDYQFAAGHRLRLVLASTDFAYAGPRQAAVYRVALAGAGLTVPTDPGLRVAGGGAPWWTWAAPIAALAAAAVILLARRRGRPAPAPTATAATATAAAGPAPIAHAPTSAEPTSPEPTGLDSAEVPLVITSLTKRYRDGQLAVDGLSLRVDRGQILGLLGPNGAGKTTTLRMLMGLIHPDAGTITIFGQRVHPGAPGLSRLGSFVEGPGFLPHLSGRANLDLYWRATGRPGADAHLAEVLQIAGLGPALDRRVRSYSRGMRQRLAIAQAMLGLPDLLVLDEPMNGLDPPQIREMRDVLLGYAAAGRTVILSSHLLGEVEQTCSHVVVMNQGRRVAAGPVAEITGAAVDGVAPSSRLEDAFLSLIAAADGTPTRMSAEEGAE